jgi:hypothetical protein
MRISSPFHPSGPKLPLPVPVNRTCRSITFRPQDPAHIPSLIPNSSQITRQPEWPNSWKRLVSGGIRNQSSKDKLHRAKKKSRRFARHGTLGPRKNRKLESRILASLSIISRPYYRLPPSQRAGMSSSSEDESSSLLLSVSSPVLSSSSIGSSCVPLDGCWARVGAVGGRDWFS